MDREIIRKLCEERGFDMLHYSRNENCILVTVAHETSEDSAVIAVASPNGVALGDETLDDFCSMLEGLETGTRQAQS